MNKVTFKSRKEATEFLKTKGIDTSGWTEEKWQSINQSQAEIHIQAIAELMWDAYNESKPKELKGGEWHIPDLGHEFDEDKIEDLRSIYQLELDSEDKEREFIKVMISTAHCAKIPYDNFGTKVDYEADIRLHDMLLESGHFSPFEHVARAMSDEEYDSYTLTEPSYSEEFDSYATKGICRNFKGFIQYRHLIETKIINYDTTN